MNHAKTLLEEYNKASQSCHNDTELQEVQKQLLAPFIDEERLIFIRAEYARLQSVLGDEYNIGDETYIFHPLPETEEKTNMPTGNPEELTLTELIMLPQLEKKIPRLGTMSYMPLFRLHPTDSVRLNLLANMEEKLKIGKLCSPEQINTLLLGHDEYVTFKTQWDDIVIIKE